MNLAPYRAHYFNPVDETYKFAQPLCKKIDLVIATGSTDGLMATAALFHLCTLNKQLIRVIFTQAFEVNNINCSGWEKNLNVGFLDLAVNTIDKQMTINFVERITKAGHKIIFIADEHGKELWQEVYEEVQLPFDDLIIKPENRSEEFPSTCKILEKSLSFITPHAQILLRAGDNADKFEFRQGSIEEKLLYLFAGCPKEDREKTLDMLCIYFSRCLLLTKSWEKDIQNSKTKVEEILKSATLINDDIIFCRVESPQFHSAIIHKAYEKRPCVIYKYLNYYSIATKLKNIDFQVIFKDFNVSGMPCKINFSATEQTYNIMLKILINHLSEIDDADKSTTSIY